MNTPCGFRPSASYLLPSGRVVTFETNVQAPTSCSLSGFPCAKASLLGSATPKDTNAIVAVARVNNRPIVSSYDNSASTLPPAVTLLQSGAACSSSASSPVVHQLLGAHSDWAPGYAAFRGLQ